MAVDTTSSLGEPIGSEGEVRLYRTQQGIVYAHPAGRCLKLAVEDGKGPPWPPIILRLLASYAKDVPLSPGSTVPLGNPVARGSDVIAVALVDDADPGMVRVVPISMFETVLAREIGTAQVVQGLERVFPGGFMPADRACQLTSTLESDVEGKGVRTLTFPSVPASDSVNQFWVGPTVILAAQAAVTGCVAKDVDLRLKTAGQVFRFTRRDRQIDGERVFAFDEAGWKRLGNTHGVGSVPIGPFRLMSALFIETCTEAPAVFQALLGLLEKVRRTESSSRAGGGSLMQRAPAAPPGTRKTEAAEEDFPGRFRRLLLAEDWLQALGLLAREGPSDLRIAAEKSWDRAASDRQARAAIRKLAPKFPASLAQRVRDVLPQ